MSQQPDDKAARGPRRAAPSADAGSTAIEQLRELLTSEPLEATRSSLRGVEARSRDGILAVRRELLDRLRRTLRALDFVNQTIHESQTAREEEFQSQLAAIDERLEDRASFLEAKIYTVVADVERRLSEQFAVQSEQIQTAIGDIRVSIDARSRALETHVGQVLAQAGAQVADRAAVIDRDLAERTRVQDATFDEQFGALQVAVVQQVEDAHQQLDATLARLQRELTTQAALADSSRERSDVATQAALAGDLQALKNRLVAGNDLAGLLRGLGDQVIDGERRG